jgi:hypothetical protein
MASVERLDRRLQERKRRHGQLSQEEVDRDSNALSDLADNVHRPDEEELERVRKELELEGVARADRIQRALTEPREPLPVLPIPPEPEPEPEPEV